MGNVWYLRSAVYRNHQWVAASSQRYQTYGLRPVELTANNWAVFTVGRIFAYLATGLVENAVPSYTSELAPAPLRGFLSGSLVFIVTIGNLWGAGIARQYDTVTTNKGWMIPTSMQLIPPVILFIALPFTPGKSPPSEFPPRS